MSNGKYYWLRLQRNFFKRHDITIIEAMPNGKDYILFYLKLLCESVDHEGNLRFSDEIPYDEGMLATITNTNIDVVRSAINVFNQLGMITIMDDGTYYMNEVNKMIGSSSQDEHTKESTRLRVRAYRERQKKLQLSETTHTEIDEKRYSNVTCNGEIDIELEKEIDIDKENISIDTNIKESDNDTKVLSEVETMFEDFWKQYPKKINKKGCFTKFKNIKGIKKEFPSIMEALEKFKQSRQWQNTQYIPHPATWLNQERWKDEIQENSNEENWNKIDMSGW